jgi:hypothetical protein
LVEESRGFERARGGSDAERARHFTKGAEITNII